MTKLESLKVTVRWSAFSSTRGLHPARPGLSSYFTAVPHRGMFTQFGVDPSFCVVPHSLKPKVGFHEWATSSRSGIPQLTSQRRVPYLAVRLTDDIEGTISSIKADVFPGQIVAQITAELEVPWNGNLESSIEPIFTLRSMRNMPIINHLALSLIASAQGEKSIDGFSVDHTYFGLQLDIPMSSFDFQSAKESLERTLTGLLIGVSNNATLENVLIENVQRASEQMNQKSSVERMMLNRLGMVRAVPINARGPHLDRFNRTMDIAILAHYCREFFRDKELFKQNELLQAHFVGSKVRMWVENPELIFGSSYSHTVTWKTLSNAVQLSQWLSHWDRTLEPISPDFKYKWEATSRSEWWLVPDLSLELKNAQISRGWKAADRLCS